MTEKPIKEWTLAEAQQWCYEYRTKLQGSRFCEESDCMLRKRGICYKDWVHDWDLSEPPRFNQTEIEVVKAVKLLFPSATHLMADDAHIYVMTDSGCPVYVFLQQDGWFSSLKNGETVDLGEILAE